jgi:hypothetical protein
MEDSPYVEWIALALYSRPIFPSPRSQTKKCRERVAPISFSRLSRHLRERRRFQERMETYWLSGRGGPIRRLQRAEIDPLHFAREQVEWDGARSDCPGALSI